MNSWFRMYAEFRSDPKVRTMSDTMQIRLVRLFCLRCDGLTERLSQDELMYALGCNDSETFHETQSLFLSKGFIDEKWCLENWDKRQFLSDSSTARVRKYRANQAPKQNETLHETHETQNVTDQNRTEQIHKQHSSRAKKQREPKSDDRHMEFKAAIGAYWEAKNPGVAMPWGPMEGKQLGMWLREAPHITLDQFTGFLRARFRSDVNHSDRPSQWIRWITSYGSGPIDRFGKPIQEGDSNGGNGKNNQSATKQRVDGARRVLAQIAIERGLIDPAGGSGGLGAEVPESGPGEQHQGILSGLRAVGSQVLAGKGTTRPC